MGKNLLSKKSILENWTPVLTGDYTSGPGLTCDSPFIAPDAISYDNCKGNIEAPGDERNRVGNPLSIATWYINGAPLSSWSTRMGGSAVDAYRHSMMQNFYTTQKIFKTYFGSNGIGVDLDFEFEDIEITKLKILKMNPTNGGIYFDIFISFEIKDIDATLFGKFENVNNNTSIPEFRCAEINNFKKENKIKIKGKIWNLIKTWFQPKPGIYNTIANEVLVYNELGQLHKLQLDNKIEVIKSNEYEIILLHNNTKYIIKKPTYFWFNWYFKKN